MGKYAKQTNKKKPLLLWGAVALALILLIAWALRVVEERATPELGQQDVTQTTSEAAQITSPTRETIPLDGGLTITSVGSYAGIYMEDGTDETVSGVMMILLENTSGKDLQLARIEMEYLSMTAQFEVTNLPAGESVVLLERSRQSVPQETCEEIRVNNLVFFSEPMGRMEDKLEIIGGDGYIDVKNISGEDLTGELYIYYKNSSLDLFYGGITYRAKIENGLSAGASVRVLTGHYTEGGSRIVHVVGGV